MAATELLKRLTEGITRAIGNTPLIALERVPRPAGMRLFAKLEGCNPWGSIKDRTALSMVREAIENGKIGPKTVVVESTSGNMGLGLAFLCNYLGLRFICVVDRRTSSSILNILRLLDAEVVMVDVPAGSSETLLSARLAAVKRICADIPNNFWPNQYKNLSNPSAHWITMQEITDQIGGEVSVLFCPVSTCGTLRGCIQYIRSHGLKTAIVAVDAVGSSIDGSAPGQRLLPGHGAGIVPPHYDASLVDDHVHISDAEAIEGCRRLLRFESVLVGASSGAAIMAVQKTRLPIRSGASCVVILPDRGERYLDSVYSQQWLQGHGLE